MGNSTWWWADPKFAWNAKAARAKNHIDDLTREITEYLTGGTFNVIQEAGQESGETIYRLEMSDPIPIRFSTMIGDAIHNLRSALDCAAFEMARRHVNRSLTEEEEQACAFPIYRSRSGLEGFFSDQRRAHLYGPRQQQAISSVQPGHLYDDMLSTGQHTQLPDRDREVAYDPLFVLNRLSNIDKHRRLHVTVAWPDLVYWPSEGPTKRRWIWGRPPFEDGAILGRLLDDPENPEPSPSGLHHEMDLRLPAPEGASSTDIRRLLEAMHTRIANYVLPRILGAPSE